MSKIKNLIFKKMEVDRAVVDEVVLINIRRSVYVAAATMLVNLLVFILFSAEVPQVESVRNIWRTHIILSHGLMFLVMAVLGGLSFYHRKTDQVNVIMKLNQYLTIIALMIFGVVIVTIDQLVTYSIMPFLILCTAIGAIYVIRPIMTIVLYSTTFVVFYFAMDLAPIDPAQLLSNRVNGLAMIAVGICLSLLGWKNNVENINQRRYIAEQQDELQKKNRELESLAFFDPLTKLFNRRRFEELIKKDISEIGSHNSESCLVILDIDHFKRVNDRYGHPAGDTVLLEIAAILKDNIRESDYIARWGGEEFLIMLPRTNLAEAQALAEKIRTIIKEKPLMVQHQQINVTASFGVAKLNWENPDSLELAYKNADNALYMAKEGGRNRVVLAEDIPEKLENGLPFVSVHLEWRSEWECGNTIIDQQHREMIELADRLIDISLSKTDPALIFSQLDRLMNHIVHHFEEEEQILKNVGYDCVPHAAIHASLVSKAFELRCALHKGEMSPIALLGFIVDDVVLGHLLKEDIKFFYLFSKEESACNGSVIKRKGE